MTNNCSICFCEEENFMKLDFCGHSFCKECWTEYINTEISSLNILKIKCPEKGCQEILSPPTLQETLDIQTFGKYQGLLLKKLDNKSRTNANICPQPGCSRLFSPLENASHTVCPCGAVICNFCGLLNHEGKSCVAALDPEFETFAAKNDLKFCVMCKTIVSRIAGCTHLTCPVCDYEWCWLCGREHNTEHPRFCPRKWDPLPPALVLNEAKQKETEDKSGLQKFKDFLKTLFYAEFFWPYLLFNVPAELRSVDNSLCDKIQVFIMAFIIHMIYICPIIFFIIRIFITPEFTPVILGCVLILGGMPWYIKLFCILCFDDSYDSEEKEKRWQSRNAQDFRFKIPAENSDDDVIIDVESNLQQSQMPLQIFEKGGSDYY